MHARNPSPTALPRRSEVPVAETWCLEHLYSTSAAWEAACSELSAAVRAFGERWRGRAAAELDSLLADYESLLVTRSRVASYARLGLAGDYGDPDWQQRSEQLSQLEGRLGEELAWLDSELQDLDPALLTDLARREPDLARFVERIAERRAHRLHPEAERVLGALKPALDFPCQGYSTTKLADMRFHPFVPEADMEAPVAAVGDGALPNSFVLYENRYQTEKDTAVRRAAFRSFSEGLGAYRHTIAGYLSSWTQQERTLARLRGYPDTFSMLLARQQVEHKLYERQIDVSVKRLAPVMRRYAAKLGAIAGLDRVHFADLKRPIADLELPGGERLSIDCAREMAVAALGVLGPDYARRVEQSFAERWTDFAANQGKSTGGFCNPVPGVHPYILLSWDGRLADLFTLVHELGHAVHFELSFEHVRLLAAECSQYLVEAPSTMNELLLGQYLMQEARDEATRSRVAAMLVTNTYYHNFVTHLLEAHWQREVYRAVDRGETLGADDYDRLFRETLERFWGDAVVLDPGAERTWMRQPHYYMGLYPYTYSAGLTIATAAAERIRTEGQPAVDDWLACLAGGGTWTVTGFARRAGTDITRPETLPGVIDAIGRLVDRIAVE
ncbi:MAG: M3 family metallopeptidase [Bacillota bacterium]|nr:M3 family metallopeptidase [Bacillota bacterium]